MAEQYLYNQRVTKSMLDQSTGNFNIKCWDTVRETVSVDKEVSVLFNDEVYYIGVWISPTENTRQFYPRQLKTKFAEVFKTTKSLVEKAQKAGTSIPNKDCPESFDVYLTDEIDEKTQKRRLKFVPHVVGKEDIENNNDTEDSADDGSHETSIQTNEPDDEFSYKNHAQEFCKYNASIHAETRIYYGTPGCGKSYFLRKKLEDNGFKQSNIFRTTFYSDYTYSDFVGQILPHVDGDRVTYRFIPGVFTRALECAIAYPVEKIALVIEEINRGDAPSIFGDIFQLLDRKDGISEYEIIQPNIVDYLNDKFKGAEYNFVTIRLPANLFIYATMNTSDQNVFTLDTAFKRRWKMTKVSNTFDGDEIGKMLIPGFTVNGVNVTWQRFVETINDHIVNNASMINAEDKQLGKYFVTEADLISETDLTKIDSSNELNEYQRKRKEAEETKRLKKLEDKAKDFANKVLEYIWSDVAKFNRKDWFRENIKSFDVVLEKRDFNDIFSDSLVGRLNKWPEK